MGLPLRSAYAGHNNCIVVTPIPTAFFVKVSYFGFGLSDQIEYRLNLFRRARISNHLAATKSSKQTPFISGRRDDEKTTLAQLAPQPLLGLRAWVMAYHCRGSSARYATRGEIVPVTVNSLTCTDVREV